MLGKRASEREFKILEFAYKKFMDGNPDFNILELDRFYNTKVSYTSYYLYESSVLDLWDSHLLRLALNCPKRDRWEITNLGIKHYEESKKKDAES